MSLPYREDLVPLAKELRKNATSQENLLWYRFLRTYPVRFQRQKPIDNYIVDFYCSSAKLAIELDGSQHFIDDGPESDGKRTEALNLLGVEVMRFTNLDIERSFYAVCTMIDHAVRARIGTKR